MIATSSSTHPDYDSDAGTVSSLETPAMSHRSSQQKLTAKGEEKKAKAKRKVKTSHTRKTHPTQSHVKANGTTTAKAKLLPKAESDDESILSLENGPAPGSQPNSQPAQITGASNSQPAPGSCKNIAQAKRSRTTPQDAEIKVAKVECKAAVAKARARLHVNMKR